MSTHSASGREIQYRPLVADDVGRVPADCHGGLDDLAARVGDLGAAAILAYDGAQHVGQLQFRRYQRALRSENGIWSPDYWGDFGGRGVDLPPATIAVHCYHVGQLTDGDARDPRYHGRGIGVALLDHLLLWAQSSGIAAVVAKSTPHPPEIMKFMGGLPGEIYVSRGFELVETWVDDQLLAEVRERGLVAKDAFDAEAFGRVGMCVKRLS